MNNEIPQEPRIVNFTDETLNQASTPIGTHQKTSTHSSGFLFAFTAFVAALVAYFLYGPLIYLLVTETPLYFLQNINLIPYIGLIAIVVSVFGVIVLIKNIGKRYGYVRNLLPLTFLIHTALIFVPLIPALNDPANYLMAEKYILYGVVGSAVMTLLALIFSIIILYRNSKILGIVLMFGLIGVTGWAVLANNHLKSTLEQNAGYGSPEDTHTNSGPQKINTVNGVVYFELGNNVDFESWGNSSTSLGLVFTENSKGSGTLYGGCGAGSSFIEVREEQDVSFNKNFKLNERIETYGENTYQVYNWSIEPSISYYELPYQNTMILIVYRPNEPCAVGKNYKADLELLLKTFKYEGLQKSDSDKPTIQNTSSAPTVNSKKVVVQPTLANSGSNTYQSQLYPGLTFTPKIDSKYINNKDIEGFKTEIFDWKSIQTQYDCENAAHMYLSKPRDQTDKDIGIARVNACLYVLFNSTR